MTPQTITSADVEKSLSITITNMNLSADSDAVISLQKSMDMVNNRIALDSITYSNGTATITSKDARSYAITIQPDPPNPPKFKIVSDSFWLIDDFPVLRSCVEVIMSLVTIHGLSAMTVTYA